MVKDRPKPPAADPLADLLDGSALPPAGASPFGVDEEQVLNGKYRLERELARGGMGVLYRATDLRKDTAVAVKVLHWWEDNPTALRRFRREAEIASRLDHPNVVRLLDFGKTAESIHYIVMELLEGEDLAVRLHDDQHFEDLSIVAAIVGQCASALQTVHDAGVIHRDLKPGNIFLCGDPLAPVVKLLDFGISKLLDAESSLTGRQTVLGGLGYMSPEQALGLSAGADHRADVYALGAITYRMLTGEPPFFGQSLTSIIQAIAVRPPRPPSLLRPLPPSVDAVILRSLSKQPDDRQSSVLAFWQELAPALAEAE